MLFFVINLFLITLSSAQSIVGSDSLFNQFGSTARAKANHFPYFIISYKNESCLPLNGIEVIRKLNNSHAVIKITASNFNIYSTCIGKVVAANNKWKLSPSLAENQPALLKQKNKTVVFSITAMHVDSLLLSFRRKKMPIELISVFKEAQSAVIACSAPTLFELVLQEPELLFADIYLKPETDLMISGFNRNINTINLTDYFLPHANGNGITIGIKEHSMDETDIDLQKRVVISTLASPEKIVHATTVATLAGGAGNSFYSGKGVAWKCNFFPSSFSNLFPDSSHVLAENNVTVQNHSYGTQIQSFYGAEALSYDAQTSGNNTLLHVFSAGNRGTEAAQLGAYAGLNGFANLTGNFKMAKNIISVAAVDTGGKLAIFSSAGPLYDGRLAPQITALGPNGTSEAAAIVSGAIAVMQQVYKDSNTQVLPPASLIKAVLFTAADDIGYTGIDYRSGFGLLNIHKAVSNLQQRKYAGGELEHSQVWQKKIIIPAQAANLKITLAWTDTTASVNDHKALSNDLDMELIEVNSGTVYYPWCLNTYPHIDSLKKLPVRKRDSLNTAEQISIELPADGEYLIRIIAKQIITTNKQPFNVAYTWDTLNTLRFTSPVHPEDVSGEESALLKIKWSAVFADTCAIGNLYITLNNGQTWQAIGSSIHLLQQSFNWLMPEITTVAQLRMDCSFGSFFSNHFIIAPLTKINVDYVCGDSVRLSWKKNVLATAYRIYGLGDTPYIKPTMMVTDTFVVFGMLTHPETIYAVEPILFDGLQAPRSVALNVLNQGVDCYYTALQAEVTGDDTKLLLQLSFLYGIDSMAFEQVTAGGQFIKTVEKLLPTADQLDYSSLDTSPISGRNYYRVKINIGARVIYTETVDVIHVGENLILVYPNPVLAQQTIHVKIKESVGEGTVEVMNILGSSVGNFPINGNLEIETATWVPGMYICRLLTGEGEVAAIAKFNIK